MTTEQPKRQYRPKPKQTTEATIQVAPMTIEQFRSYLKGIMFVGGPEWHPTRQQWNAVVDIIDNLIVEPTSEQRAPVYQQPIYSPPMLTPEQMYPAVPPRSFADAAPPSDDSAYSSPFV